MLQSTSKIASIILSHAGTMKREVFLKRICMNKSTFSRRIRNPQSFTLYELQLLNRVCHFSDEELRAFFHLV